MSNFTMSLKEDLIRQKVRFISNEEIFDIMNSNDDELGDYKYKHNWFYQLWNWQSIKDLKNENELLHQIIVERMKDSQLKTPVS